MGTRAAVEILDRATAEVSTEDTQRENGETAKGRHGGRNFEVQGRRCGVGDSSMGAGGGRW